MERKKKREIGRNSRVRGRENEIKSETEREREFEARTERDKELERDRDMYIEVESDRDNVKDNYAEFSL